MTNNQINKWNFRHAQLMLALIVLVLMTKRIELLSLGVIISFSVLFYKGSSSLSKMSPPGGYANWITGFRLLLIIVGIFLFGTISKLVIFIIMTTAVLLDGLDGFLARKRGESSTLGGYFDMEVDAFFVLIMCFYYFNFEGTGWWILVPGVLRYLYKVLTTILLKPNYVETKRKYASYIAGIFFIVLCMGIIVEGEIIKYCLMIGSLLIVFSFGISTLEYVRFNNVERSGK